MGASSLRVTGSGSAVVEPEGASGAMSVPVLAVRGELDSASCQQLVDAVEAALDASGAPGDGVGAARMVLDLDDVSFCDSRGLSALVGVVTAAAHRGWSVRLSADAESAVRRLLARVAMTEVLALHPSAQDAATARGPSPLEAEIHGR